MPDAIRRYTPADACAVHTIAADTAFYGAPVEYMMEDRRLFIDAFVRLYTDHFPGTCWVAEVGGQTVGYLTGCPNSRARAVLYRRYLRRVLVNALMLRYRLGPRAARAGFGFVRQALHGEPMVDLNAYPAHLHINVAAGYRGRGLGRRLMLAFIDQCRQVGLPGIHLSTSGRNAVAAALYRALGFVELARYPSPFHRAVTGSPVDGLIFGLRL